MPYRGRSCICRGALMLPFFYSLGVSMRKTHLVVNGISTSRYPLTPKVGTIGKYHPSKVPTLRVTNSFHVSEMARTFGFRSRI